MTIWSTWDGMDLLWPGDKELEKKPGNLLNKYLVPSVYVLYIDYPRTRSIFMTIRHFSESKSAWFSLLFHHTIASL
jgi:hypothetical protein